MNEKQIMLTFLDEKQSTATFNQLQVGNNMLSQWIKDEELHLGHIEIFVKDYEKLNTLLQEAVSKSRKLDDIHEALVRVSGVEMPSSLQEIKETGFWTISFDSITTEIEIGKLQLDEWFTGHAFNEEDDDIEDFENLNIYVAEKFLEKNGWITL